MAAEFVRNTDVDAPRPSKRRCMQKSEQRWWQSGEKTGWRARPRRSGCFSSHAAVCPVASRVGAVTEATELKEVDVCDGAGRDRVTLQCPWCEGTLFRCDVCSALTTGAGCRKMGDEGTSSREEAPGDGAVGATDRFCENCGVYMAFNEQSHTASGGPSSLQVRESLMRLPPSCRFSSEEAKQIQVDAFGARSFIHSKTRALCAAERKLQEMVRMRNNDTSPADRTLNSSMDVDFVLKTPMGMAADGDPAAGGDDVNGSAPERDNGDTLTPPFHQHVDDTKKIDANRLFEVGVQYRVLSDVITRHRWQLQNVGGVPSRAIPTRVSSLSSAADAVLIEEKVAYINGCCEALGIVDDKGVMQRCVEYCRLQHVSSRMRKRAAAVEDAENAFRMSAANKPDVIQCAGELVATGTNVKVSTEAAMQSTADMISRVFQGNYRRALSMEARRQSEAQGLKTELNATLIRRLSQVCGEVHDELKESRHSDRVEHSSLVVSHSHDSRERSVAFRIAALREVYAWCVLMYRAIDVSTGS